MFTPEQWKKVSKGLMIAVGGAVLTYASTVLLPLLQTSSDPVKLATAAVASALINAGLQWLKGQKDETNSK